MTVTMTPEPFRPEFDPAEVEDLRQRLVATRLRLPEETGWERGTPSSWLLQLVEDWQKFDAEAFAAELLHLEHRMVVAGGRPLLHLVVSEGQGPRPLPLVLTHGWPGSFLEYLDLLPLLTDPAASGADAADSFTVVVPSLPGYGFSAAPPPGGFSADEIARLWHRLMHDGLGFERYVAHGSDLGASVTARLARAHPEAILGIHLATPGLAPAPTPWSSEEESYAAQAETWMAEEGGYGHEHGTKPLTLAAALSDSPVGLGAWIGEKVFSWSSTTSEGDPNFKRERLLETLTLYWLTGTIATSFLPYWNYRHNPLSALPTDDPCHVPTTVSLFGGERVPFPKPPRKLGDRYFTIVGWEEHDRGGHFPAVAEPGLLAESLRKSFRPLREA